MISGLAEMTPEQLLRAAEECLVTTSGTTAITQAEFLELKAIAVHLAGEYAVA